MIFCLLTNVFLPCHWKRRCVLFLLVQRMFLVVVQVTGRPFFSPYFLFFPEKYILTFFVVGISTLVHILLISNFYSLFFFCKSFICFQFHHLIPIYKCYISQFDPSSLVCNFFLDCFVKVLLVFNFIFHPKLMVLCFLI